MYRYYISYAFTARNGASGTATADVNLPHLIRDARDITAVIDLLSAPGTPAHQQGLTITHLFGFSPYASDAR